MTTVLSKQFALEQLEGVKLFLNQLNLNEKLSFITKANVTKAAGATLAGLILLYIGKIWYAYRYFKKQGIKTPKYEFFYGHYRIFDTKNMCDQLREWTKEFGKTYGIFEGHSPVLVTSDLDIVQEVFVKQASNFSARKENGITARKSDPSHGVFTSSDVRWKRMRNIMNPTFSSAKLKELSPLMLKCTDRLDQRIDLSCGKEINVADYMKRYTMDTIWNCAFGVDVNIQFDKSKENYYETSEEVFRSLANKNMLIKAGIYFYELRYILADIVITLSGITTKVFNKSVIPSLWLFEKVTEIVDTRVKEKIPRKDYLQLLMEALTTEKIKDHDNASIELQANHYNKKLTLKEIKTNLVTFMLAGYETTSTTLIYASFVLAKHPEVQQKLYEDIVSVFPEDSNVEPEIDTVQELKYTDMFIKEVLRMYPVAIPIVNRRCTKATTIKGIHIPVGADVMLDAMSLHYDPELWGPVDPNQFYPERFAEKRNPLAFAAFGLGPRNCVGMKFALQELKFSLVKLIRKYEVAPAANMPDKLEIVEGVVRSPKNGVTVIFNPRNNSN